MPSSRVTEKPFTTLLGEILSVTAGVKTEYPSSALMHSTIKTAAIATIMWKPWIVRIVAIVQSNFWTMGAIATIVTIIWKPGFINRESIAKVIQFLMDSSQNNVFRKLKNTLNLFLTSLGL